MMETCWNAGAVPVSEDGLLLREFAHRTLNEVAAALAALRLVTAARTEAGRRVRIEEAIARLEAFADVHQLLAAPVPQLAELGAMIERLCRGLGAIRPTACRSRIDMDLGEAWIDGRLARRCALIAAELINNAIRHGLEGRSGTLKVAVRRRGDEVSLLVADDGPGFKRSASSRGTGHGGGIVAELVDRAGGRMTVTSGAGGTAISVSIPVRSEGGEEDVDF